MTKGDSFLDHSVVFYCLV